MFVMECECGIVYVIVDVLEGVMKCVYMVWEVIFFELVIVCLYGCNVLIWSGVELVVEWFNYEYGDDELCEFV